MTPTTLIIARHGNTFAPGENPRRVGARTDLPLVASGLEQARKLGEYLKAHNLIPERVYTSEMKRAQQTAELAATEFGPLTPFEVNPLFNEIDYGPDENQDEAIVRARLGEAALEDWEKKGIMPTGWSPSSEEITLMWHSFSETLHNQHAGKRTLVVTSNGIARFALQLTGDWDRARSAYGLKLATGALGILTRKPDDSHWSVVGWNIRP